MIRNVVVGRVHGGTDPAAVTAALNAIAALEPPGLVDLKLGTNLGLREAAWDFAITSDFVDEQAYLDYDADEQHNLIRRELLGPICEQLARVQFRAG